MNLGGLPDNETILNQLPYVLARVSHGDFVALIKESIMIEYDFIKYSGVYFFPKSLNGKRLGQEFLGEALYIYTLT